MPRPGPRQTDAEIDLCFLQNASEVGRRLDPKRFTLRTLQKRLDAVGDLFAPALRSTQRLPAPGKVGAPG